LVTKRPPTEGWCDETIFDTFDGECHGAFRPYSEVAQSHRCCLRELIVCSVAANADVNRTVVLPALRIFKSRGKAQMCEQQVSAGSYIGEVCVGENRAHGC
jgi:hypothetical protein